MASQPMRASDRAVTVMIPVLVLIARFARNPATATPARQATQASSGAAYPRTIETARAGAIEKTALRMTSLAPLPRMARNAP